MLASLLLLASLQTTQVTGHICATISTVQLLPGESAERQRGADFDVYHVKGPKGDFGVYDGFASEVSSAQSETAFKRGSVTISRMRIGGQFAGYLVTIRVGKSGPASQNHFFGTLFKGDASDDAFFDRVSFGPCMR